MSAVPPHHGVQGNDELDASAAIYRRLGAMDPPVLRALVPQLQRLSDERRAQALRQPSAAATANAAPAALRAAAARAALTASDEQRA